MRIVYAYTQLLPSTAADTEQVLSTVAAFGRAGAEVELLVPRWSGGRELTPDALRAHYQVEGPFTVRQVDAVLERAMGVQKTAHGLKVAFAEDLSRFDVVYTRNVPVLAPCLARGHRVAFEAYRPWPRQYPWLEVPFARWMLHPGFAGAILHSELARDSYRDIGVPEERLLVAHNGHDPKRLEPRLDRAEARRLVGLPVDARIATYSGRINANKGLDVVLAMAERRPDVLFVLVGSEGRGPIERAAERLPNVRIVPWQKSDGVIRHLYAADVLVIPPSLAPLEHGGTVLPMKLLLYLAIGRAILAPLAPDTAELLRDGENAALVPPGDAAAASDALARILEDERYAARLAEGSRRTASALTWDARAERILRFLDERLRAPATRARRTNGRNLGSTIGDTSRWIVERSRAVLG